MSARREPAVGDRPAGGGDAIDGKLREITEFVAAARAMPMSASCVLNRAELLALLEELRALVPDELRQARRLLGERDAVIAEGRSEADRIVAAAEGERSRLVAETEVSREARLAAERLVEEAHQQVAQLRHQVDDYVDARLATFEVALTKTLAAVERGREKLRGRTPAEALGAPADEKPLPGY